MRKVVSTCSTVPGPDDVAASVWPWEDYTLARSLVDSETPEDDLFAGIRASVSDPRAR